MMLRFLPALAVLCRKVILINHHPAITHLIKSCPDVINAVTFLPAHRLKPLEGSQENIELVEGEDTAELLPFPYYDAHCGLMSLPYLLQVTADNIIAPVPIVITQKLQYKYKIYSLARNLVKCQPQCLHNQNKKNDKKSRK